MKRTISDFLCRRTRQAVACTIGVLCGCVFLNGVRATVAAQAAAPAGDAERGRRGFVKYGCYQCHGREAQGSPSTGPRLGPTTMTAAAFAAYVRRPRAEMPPYSTRILADSDLADLFAFAASRPRPASIPPSPETP